VGTKPFGPVIGRGRENFRNMARGKIGRNETSGLKVTQQADTTKPPVTRSGGSMRFGVRPRSGAAEELAEGPRQPAFLALILGQGFHVGLDRARIGGIVVADMVEQPAAEEAV
jgi:hypothetical protein